MLKFISCFNRRRRPSILNSLICIYTYIAINVACCVGRVEIQISRKMKRLVYCHTDSKDFAMIYIYVYIYYDLYVYVYIYIYIYILI